MAQHMPASPHQSSSCSPSLPLTAVFERLRQLKAWQQQQQETLLRQQQEQLLKLRTEQAQQRSLMAVATTALSSEENQATRNASTPPICQINDCVRPGPATENRITTALADGRRNSNIEPSSDTGPESLSPTSPSTSPPPRPMASSPQHTDGSKQRNEEDRPIRPAIRDGTTTSFDDYIEAQLRLHQSPPLHPPSPKTPPAPRSFLKRGQGIARFHMKPHHLQQHKTSSNTPASGTKVRGPNATKAPGQQPGPPAGGGGSGQSHRAMVRKVARGEQHSSVESLAGLRDHDFPRESTPAMMRCSSEDSFIVRKTQRSKWEEDELREFELLEQAAANISLSQSSQASTVEDTHTQNNHSPPYTYPDHYSPSNEEDAPTLDSDNELDSTLRASPPPATSLAAGVDFNDDEAWESFSKPSPIKRLASLESISSEQESLCGDREQNLMLTGRGVEICEKVSIESALRSEHSCEDLTAVHYPREPVQEEHSVSVTDTAPLVHVSAPSEDYYHHPPPPSHPSHLSHASHSHPTSITLSDPADKPIPPPSTLLSKLFPALRPPKPNDPLKHSILPEHSTPLAPETPSPAQSVAGDSGKESSLSSASGLLGDELRLKLAQLEMEIERYRTENARLERLRVEREEGLSLFKREVEEFQRQKNEEVNHFEQYKREELRKLKRDRKVLETHQAEAKTARDRRDKEEIEQLKKQLSNACEELRQKESRWSATLTRYRKKIEGLEAQNSELQGDLRVMEQERLAWWQEQIEEKENRARNKTKKQSPVPRAALKESPSPSNTNTKQTPPKSILISQPSTKPKTVSAKTAKNRSPKKAKPILQTNRTTPQSNSSSGHNNSPQRHNSDGEYTLSDDSKERQDELGRMEEALDSSELEIVDVFCNNYDRGTRGSPHPSGYQSDSELSMIADDIVSDVIGVEHVEGVGHTRREQHWSTPTATPTPEDERESKEHSVRRTKTVTFSTEPLASPSSTAERSTPQSVGNDGSVTESTQSDGSKVIQFSNGTRKVVSCDGRSLSVHFFNGDVKHVKPDQTVVYYYAESQTTHTTLPDGLQVLDFPNHQIEKHYPDGTKEITFPDKTVKTIHPSGEEESVFSDGNTQRHFPNGDLLIQFTNGQKEFHTREYKRREYPDGTVKTVYPDGRQETRYSSGRVRIKDKSGRVLVDKVEPNT